MATASYVVITPVSNLALSLLASCLVFQNFDIICDLKYIDVVVGKMQCSQRKQLTFDNFSTDTTARYGLGNEYRNSILMMHHFSDLGSASDWLK